MELASLKLPRAALAIVVLALVLRVVLIASAPDYVPVYDAWDYDRHARSIAAGDGYPGAILAEGPSAFRPPLYPALLAATYEVLPGTLTAGRLLGALLGSVTVLLIFLIADRFWGRQPWLVAGGIAAIFPPLVVLSAGLSVESVFIPLELGLVLAVLAYIRSEGALRWAVVGGLLCGLAALTRPNGFLLAIPLVLGLVSVHGRSELRRALKPTAMALVAAAVLVAPWTIRNAVEFDGKLILVSNAFGYVLAGTYTDDAKNDSEQRWEWRPPELIPENRSIYVKDGIDEAEIDADLSEKAIRWIRDHPFDAIQAPIWNGYRLINPTASDKQTATSYDAMGVPHRLRNLTTHSYLLVALIALAGLAVTMRRRHLGPLWFWTLPIVVALSFAALNGTPRYRTMIDPFIVMLAALALTAAYDRFRSRGNGRGSSEPALHQPT